MPAANSCAALKQGTSVGLIVDQRVDSGEPVRFFGRDMLTSITPAQLALRFDCDLIPIQIQRLKGARFRAIIHDAVRPDDETADKHSKILTNDSERSISYSNPGSVNNRSTGCAPSGAGRKTGKRAKTTDLRLSCGPLKHRVIQRKQV